MKKTITTVLSFLFVVFLYSQNENSDPPVSWIDNYQEVVVSLGIKKSIKDPKTKIKKEIFSVVGTGMLFYVIVNNDMIPCLITAKHVFKDPVNDWFPNKINLRHFAFRNISLDSYYGEEIKLKDNKLELWVEHDDPKIDLACLPLPLLESQLKINLKVFPFNSIATEDDYFEGAQIMILGFPDIVDNNYKTRAIVRKGMISWIDSNSPSDNLIMIDANIYGGNSGGPAILVPSGMDKYGSFTMGGMAKFLGIVTSKGAKKVPLFNPEGKVINDTLGNSAYTWESVGIGFLEPAKKVKELLTKTKRILEESKN